MSYHYVSFATDGSYGTKALLHKQKEQKDQMAKHGFETHTLGLSDIDTNALNINTYDKGCGFWAWKPYIIYSLLSNMNNGDMLLYSDADINIGKNPKDFISTCEYMSIIATGFQQSGYTKRDCFIKMGCDSKEYYDLPQVWAGIIGFTNSEYTREFVKTWGEYCNDRQIISDDKSILGNELPGFVAHRHDQSIITNLIQSTKITRPLHNSWANGFGHPAGA